MTNFQWTENREGFQIQYLTLDLDFVVTTLKPTREPIAHHAQMYKS